MANQKVMPLGELSVPGVTDWKSITSYDSVATIHASQVSAKGLVTAADVTIEYSIDGIGGMSLQDVTLSAVLQSDGAVGIQTRAVAARMRLKSISGGGSVLGTLLVED